MLGKASSGLGATVLGELQLWILGAQLLPLKGCGYQFRGCCVLSVPHLRHCAPFVRHRLISFLLALLHCMTAFF